MFANTFQARPDLIYARLEEAVRKNDPDAIEMLVRQTGKLNLDARVNGEPLLCIAARLGHAKAANTLIFYGASLDEKTQAKERDDFNNIAAQPSQTALEIAQSLPGSKAHQAIAERLQTVISKNNNAAAQINDHLAHQRYQEAKKILLDNSQLFNLKQQSAVDILNAITAPQHKELRAFYAQNLLKHYPQADIPLTSAIAKGASSNAIEFLLHSGVSGKALTTRETDLMMETVRSGNVEIAQLLIKQCGIKLNEPVPGYGTYLHLAAASTSTAIVDFLLDQGMDVNLLPPKHFHNTDTPLHRAVRSGSEPMALHLHTRGARLDAVNHQGQTPLQIASAKVRTSLNQAAQQKAQQYSDAKEHLAQARYGDFLEIVRNSTALLDLKQTEGLALFNLVSALREAGDFELVASESANESDWVDVSGDLAHTDEFELIEHALMTPQDFQARYAQLLKTANPSNDKEKRTRAASPLEPTRQSLAEISLEALAKLKTPLKAPTAANQHTPTTPAGTAPAMAK